MPEAFDRDRVLALDDEMLGRECAFESYKGSGNGGQKRNKTSSSVRVRHLPTGVTAEDSAERSWFRNRANALRKLRLKLGLLYRNEPSPLFRPACALDHADYPRWRALLLDALAANGYEPKPAAAFLGTTPSALVKLLYRDGELWEHVARERLALGKTRLRN